MYRYILVILLPFMLTLISSCTRIHISNDKEIDAARTHLIQHNTTYADVLVQRFVSPL
jgi:Na+/phosphate symporter